MVWPLDLLFTRKKAELLSGKRVLKLSEEQIEIGRRKSKEDNLEMVSLEPSGKRISIRDTDFTSGISRTHAILTWDESLKKYRFKDISRFGSTVNGIRVREVVLEDKAQIELGEIKLQIVYS